MRLWVDYVVFSVKAAHSIDIIRIGYAYYHTSGLKTVVQTSKQMKSYMESARDRAIKSAKTNLKSPNEALNYLRGVARSYASAIPGAQSYIDTTFDSLEELSETHGEKMTEIVSKARDELANIVQKGGADVQTAASVYDVLRRTVKELQELGLQVGGDFLEKHPKVKERIGGGYAELKKLAETKGPQAKKIFDDTTSQVRIYVIPIAAVYAKCYLLDSRYGVERC